MSDCSGCKRRCYRIAEAFNVTCEQVRTTLWTAGPIGAALALWLLGVRR